MATLPIPANMTCDVWRNGHLGNPNPDIAGIQCYINPDYERHTESGEGDPTESRFTHTMLVPKGSDIRDGYSYGSYGNLPDSVSIPSGVGSAHYTLFNVVFIETKAKGTPQEHCKVYLDRITPQWPTIYT